MISDSEEITGKIVNILAYQAVITAQGENYTGEKDWALNKLRDLFKEELQKARQDWLREEIVRLENEKFVWLTPEEMKEHDGCRYKKGGLYVGQVAGDNFNGAIQIIQHRYHSELDQDVSK